MALLLLFEKSDSLSYSELEKTTNIQAEQFPRYVQSLLDSKLLNCNSEVSWKLKVYSRCQAMYVASVLVDTFRSSAPPL